MSASVWTLEDGRTQGSSDFRDELAAELCIGPLVTLSKKG